MEKDSLHQYEEIVNFLLERFKGTKALTRGHVGNGLRCLETEEETQNLKVVDKYKFKAVVKLYMCLFKCSKTQGITKRGFQ